MPLSTLSSLPHRTPTVGTVAVSIRTEQVEASNVKSVAHTSPGATQIRHLQCTHAVQRVHASHADRRSYVNPPTCIGTGLIHRRVTCRNSHRSSRGFGVAAATSRSSRGVCCPRCRGLCGTSAVIAPPVSGGKHSTRASEGHSAGLTRIAAPGSTSAAETRVGSSAPSSPAISNATCPARCAERTDWPFAIDA